ncbi:MAG: MATE family efflux transporter [Oribacterium sp.]|nr:MATE family efflux transporter [Oribacterium sp.]
MAMKKTDIIQLTKIPLWKGIFLFSLPLIASNLLQILFNISDIAVVGRFAGPIALGAVGSTTTLVTLFTTFIIGISGGVNVTVAYAIGHGKKESVTRAVFTAFVLCAVIGLLTMIFSEATTLPVLTLLNTKPSLIHGAMKYLRIYFLGIPALAIFNFGNATYSAAGNTRKPLIFLTISGFINILLNLFFVIILKMDVAGVALASTISQYFSAFCVLINILREKSMIGLKLNVSNFDMKFLRRMLPISITSGLANAIFQVANLFVQYGVNSFDAITVAGAAAAQNADGLDYDVMAAFYTAGSSFIGQNYGAGLMDRVKKIYWITIFYSLAAGCMIGLILYIFGVPFLSMFTKDAAVINAGMYRLSIMALSYGFSSFMDASIAASRGLGKSFVPTIIVILGSCVFRILWIFTVFAYFKTVTSLYLLYIFSWAITGIAEMIYFRKAYRSACRLSRSRVSVN